MVRPRKSIPVAPKWQLCIVSLRPASWMHLKVAAGWQLGGQHRWLQRRCRPRTGHTDPLQSLCRDILS